MLQVAEVAERDPEPRGAGPRRRRPEADQLGLALPAIPAIAERVVVTAGVRHELTHAGWKRAQVAKRRGHAPVRVRPRASEEMIRRHQAEVTAQVERRSEEHTSELQSRLHLVCRLLLEKKKKIQQPPPLTS